MRIYIDVEFNEFGGDLISMALVDQNGREWYEVLECADPKPWVTQHVIPVLGKPPVSKTYFQHSMADFLSGYMQVHLVADWPDDIKHFCEMLITGPGERLNTPRLSMEIRRDIDSSKAEIQHNALSDARAIRLADLRGW